MYDEFKFCEHFSLPVGYDDMPAWKVDWFTRFIRLDKQVQAAVDERARRDADNRIRGPR